MQDLGGTCDEVAMFLGSAGWFRAPETMATHNVAAGLIVQLIVDSQLLDLPPDLLLMFSLSLTMFSLSLTMFSFSLSLMANF